MPIVADDDQPRALMELLYYTETSDLKEAFIYAVLMLPRIRGISVAPEKHGVMASLGVYRDSDWCFSIKPAKQWLKIWVRRPELTGHKIGRQDLIQQGFEVEETGSKEITMRFTHFREMKAFVDLLAQ